LSAGEHVLYGHYVRSADGYAEWESQWDSDGERGAIVVVVPSIVGGGERKAEWEWDAERW